MGFGLGTGPDLVSSLAGAASLPADVVKILINRHLDTPELIKQFLGPELSDLHDPFEMAGMEQGIDRVTQALFDNEQIMIYGDYDVDGITATALLYMVLNKLGAQVSFYLPNRSVSYTHLTLPTN